MGVTDAEDAQPPGRPPVSIVIPFAGPAAEVPEMLAAVLRIRRRPDDEVIVVDNTGAETVPAEEGVRVVSAQLESSAYYARNEGTLVASNPWVLFIDADCRPREDVLERYLADPLPEDVGAVIGEVEGVQDQSALVSRYARSRGHLRQEGHWSSPFRPWGVTANLLVRREAWASVGGFHEGIRSGGDTEFSWRLQDAGWRLEYRPAAIVEHVHRDSVRRLARQAARYGAGRAWVMRRYPGSFQRPTLVRRLARSVAGVAVWTATLRFERAAFKALDGVYVASEWAAFGLWSNTPSKLQGTPRVSIAVITDDFPAADAAPHSGAPNDRGPRFHDARIEAVHRPVRVDRDLRRRLTVAYAEDDGGFQRTVSALWLMRTAPLRTARHGREALALAPAAQRLRRAGVQSIQVQGGPIARRRAELLGQLLELPVQ